MSLVGYCRTSTADQLAGLAAQERDLTAAGAERIVTEQVSSVKQRPGLDRCLASLGPGDVLMVTKPDRLARSTSHLLSIVEDLNARGIGLILLSMGGERVDTRNPTSKLILTVLAAIAAFEREIMLERQREGLAKAKANGRMRGRQPKHDWDQIRHLVEEVGASEAARRMGVARSWVYSVVGKAKVAEGADA